jgi:uncharacterized membrane protein
MSLVSKTVGGFAFLFTTPESLRKVVDWLAQEELQKDPTDLIANHLVVFFHGLS